MRRTRSTHRGRRSYRACRVDIHALQWATGFQTLMPYLLRGAKNLLLDDSEFDPGAIAAAIIDQKVTGMFMPAPMVPPIIEAYKARADAQHAIARMVIFFATPDQLDEVNDVFGPVWCHGFGSTEQGAPTSRLTAADVVENRARLQSVGRAASSFFEMAIMDEDGQRLPNGVVGEIVVRSAMSTSIYWALPDKTKDAFFAGDWFRPSDIGYIDDDGFLYYLDRARDRINTSDGVVYPHVVETALLGHAAVGGCGVVGLGPDGREIVVGAVQLRPGQVGDAALRQDIITAMQAVLSPCDCPSDIVFVQELPTVLGGAKVKREELRTQVEAMAKVT